jgi:hypothetical protein
MAAGEAKLYVYAIARAPLPARMRVLGRRLRALRIGRVAVIAGSPPARARVSPEEVQQQHAVVVQLAARTDALLPVRFGSAIAASALRALVQERQRDLLRALTLVRGRSQMTIRVFGTPDAFERPDARSSGTAFLEALRDRARHEPAEVEAFRRAVGRHAVAERVDVGDGRVRATIFHLVPRRAVAAYRRAVSAAAAALPYTVTVTGPWPPFAFVPELL